MRQNETKMRQILKKNPVFKTSLHNLLHEYHTYQNLLNDVFLYKKRIFLKALDF